MKEKAQRDDKVYYFIVMINLKIVLNQIYLEPFSLHPLNRWLEQISKTPQCRLVLESTPFSPVYYYLWCAWHIEKIYKSRLLFTAIYGWFLGSIQYTFFTMRAHTIFARFNINKPDLLLNEYDTLYLKGICIMIWAILIITIHAQFLT